MPPRLPCTAKHGNPKPIQQSYSRARDLPRLIALWPAEIEDDSVPGRLKLIAKLRRALREERRRGLAAHWAYDLGRHAGLLHAYRCELSALKVHRRSVQRFATASAGPGFPHAAQKPSR